MHIRLTAFLTFAKATEFWSIVDSDLLKNIRTSPPHLTIRAMSECPAGCGCCGCCGCTGCGSAGGCSAAVGATVAWVAWHIQLGTRAAERNYCNSSWGLFSCPFLLAVFIPVTCTAVESLDRPKEGLCTQIVSKGCLSKSVKCTTLILFKHQTKDPGLWPSWRSKPLS
jgi:hypothetical protein